LSSLLQKAIKDQQVRIAQLQSDLDDRNSQILEKNSALGESQVNISKLKQVAETNEILKTDNRK
jgi:hypothetical protein